MNIFVKRVSCPAGEILVHDMRRRCKPGYGADEAAAIIDFMSKLPEDAPAEPLVVMVRAESIPTPFPEDPSKPALE